MPVSHPAFALSPPLTHWLGPLRVLPSDLRPPSLTWGRVLQLRAGRSCLVSQRSAMRPLLPLGALCLRMGALLQDRLGGRLGGVQPSLEPGGPGARGIGGSLAGCRVFGSLRGDFGGLPGKAAGPAPKPGVTPLGGPSLEPLRPAVWARMGRPWVKSELVPPPRRVTLGSLAQWHSGTPP